MGKSLHFSKDYLGIKKESFIFFIDEERKVSVKLKRTRSISCDTKLKRLSISDFFFSNTFFGKKFDWY